MLRCAVLVLHRAHWRLPFTPAGYCPLELVAQLCASLPIQPARKRGFKTYDTMKARTRQQNSAKECPPTNMTLDIAPTPEAIRHRAQELFLARGGGPGKDLEDWLRAEQQLKAERARVRPS